MSIASVQARIAEIQSRLALPATHTQGGNFNAHLTAAVQEAAAPGTVTAAPAATGSVADIASAALSRPAALKPAGHTHNHGRVGPPPDLAAYGNGKIPPAALATIGEGNHRMWAPAAQSFQQLRQAAAADGVRMGVTDSYRSYDQQVDLAKRKGLYSQGGLAATPGTSNHGWGLSLDLDLNPKALAWMRANAERFGFDEDVPREPWHWTFTGAA